MAAEAEEKALVQTSIDEQLQLLLLRSLVVECFQGSFRAVAHAAVFEAHNDRYLSEGHRACPARPSGRALLDGVHHGRCRREHLDQGRRHATRLARAHSSTRPLPRRMRHDSLDDRVRACAHAARQVRAQRAAR